MQKLAPIALFTYNRAEHTRKAVESLLKNDEAKYSDLFVFSDGPKSEAKAAGVEENRKYIHTIIGFKTVTIVERETNWGLSKSLISGITEIVNEFGKVIVVEDDLVLSPYFLNYMNEALNKYENDDRVASVSAFLNPVDVETKIPFFLRYFACWGWATWKRSWQLLNTDSRYLLKKLRWKTNEFNIDGAGPFYGILYCEKVGLNDSWAVKFYASCFLAGKLHLFPNHCMVVQTGMDGSGTNCGVGSSMDYLPLWKDKINLEDIPIEESKIMYESFARYYNRGKVISLKTYYQKFKSFVRRLLGVDYR